MAKSKKQIRKENRNKMLIALAVIVGIVAAFLLAAYVSNNKDVTKQNYGMKVIQSSGQSSGGYRHNSH